MSLRQTYRVLLAFAFFAFAFFALFGVCTHETTQAQLFSLQQSNSVTRAIDSLTKKAEILRTRTPNKAREIAQNALQQAEQAGYIVGQTQALAVLGYVEWVQGLYEQSLATSLRALRLTREASVQKPDDSVLNGQFCVLSRQIGNVYATQRNYAKADEYYRQTYAVALRIHDTTHIILSLNNIGAIFYYANSIDSALRYYERALSLCSTTEQNELSALTLLNLGQASEKQAKYEEAMYYCVRALAICNRIGEKRYAGWSLLTLASAHRKQKRYIDAANALQSAVHLADTLSSKELLRDIYEAQTFLAEDMREFDKALEYHRLFKAMNDSMFTEQGATRIAALAAVYQDAEQRQEIELLHQTAQNQAFLRNGLVVGLILLVAVFVVLWNRYRLKKRSEAVLQQKNSEIMQQQYYLQQQAEEIAHFNQEISQFNLEISQRNELLQAANHEKTELMGIVAHDLKNPLAAIQGMAAILTMEKAWNEYSQQAAEQIVSTSYRMFSLIEQLLNVNALESGIVEMQPQALDAVSLVRSVIEHIQDSAEKKNISISLITSSDAILVQADRNALLQTTENLISNAVKYSPLGKNVIVRVLEHEMNNGNDSLLRLEVKDEGPGISEGDKKRLFGKFVRLSAQPTGGEHSTGLGLSIVKKLVEAMNGRVWCESVLGEGATFIVELPQV